MSAAEERARRRREKILERAAEGTQVIPESRIPDAEPAVPQPEAPQNDQNDPPAPPAPESPNTKRKRQAEKRRQKILAAGDTRMSIVTGDRIPPGGRKERERGAAPAEESPVAEESPAADEGAADGGSAPSISATEDKEEDKAKAVAPKPMVVVPDLPERGTASSSRGRAGKKKAGNAALAAKGLDVGLMERPAGLWPSGKRGLATLCWMEDTLSLLVLVALGALIGVLLLPVMRESVSAKCAAGMGRGMGGLDAGLGMTETRARLEAFFAIEQQGNTHVDVLDVLGVPPTEEGDAVERELLAPEPASCMSFVLLSLCARLAVHLLFLLARVSLGYGVSKPSSNAAGESDGIVMSLLRKVPGVAHAVDAAAFLKARLADFALLKVSVIVTSAVGLKLGAGSALEQGLMRAAKVMTDGKLEV
ncbi:unnamed protein product [Chrysoparadoxa australica]